MPIFREACETYPSHADIRYVSKCITLRISELRICGKTVIVPDEEICNRMKYVYESRTTPFTNTEMNEIVINDLVRQFKYDECEKQKSSEWLKLYYDPFSERCFRQKYSSQFEKPKLRGKMVGRDTSRPFAFYTTY